jgi:hypothetical protein
MLDAQARPLRLSASVVLQLDALWCVPFRRDAFSR